MRADGDTGGVRLQRRRAHLEAKLQQLTLNLAEEAGPRRSKRSRGEIIDKARGLHAGQEGPCSAAIIIVSLTCGWKELTRAVPAQSLPALSARTPMLILFHHPCSSCPGPWCYRTRCGCIGTDALRARVQAVHLPENASPAL